MAIRESPDASGASAIILTRVCKNPTQFEKESCARECAVVFSVYSCGQKYIGEREIKEINGCLMIS